MGVVAAERIKVCTSRSAVWCSLLALALGVGLAGLQGGSASIYAPSRPATRQAARPSSECHFSWCWPR